MFKNNLNIGKRFVIRQAKERVISLYVKTRFGIFWMLTLDQLLSQFGKLDSEYAMQYAFVQKLISDGIVKPIKNKKYLNHRTPPLFTRYHNVSRHKEPVQCTRELDRLCGDIDIGWYRKHPATFAKEKALVLQLNDFFIHNKGLLLSKVSCNTRSYQIWHNEKTLKNGQGKTVLDHCGIAIDALNISDFVEPLPFWSCTESTPQNVLFIENMETYHTLREFLQSKQTLYGRKIGSLVYGSGMGIVGSARHPAESLAQHVANKENTFLYFGDLDYAGIRIYEALCKVFPFRICPLTEAYLAMLEKTKNPGKMQKKQKKCAGEIFLAFFPEEQAKSIKNLLENGYYIPQETLDSSDFARA